MTEAYANNNEVEPKKEDAAKLAELLYYALDRQCKVDESEIGEIVGSIEEYIDFRARQDPGMATALVGALESFRDPDPTLATTFASQGMQERANSAREVLGLPELDLPTEPRVITPIPDQPQ